MKWMNGWSEWHGVHFEYPFLIAAFPRSGTQFIWRELRRLNLWVGHEVFGKDGVISSIHVGSGITDKIETIGNRTHYDSVLHQVRDPCRTISSGCVFFRKGLGFLRLNIEREIGEVPEDHVEIYDPERIRFVMLCWIEWNKKIERDFSPAWQYRVEDLSTRPTWHEFCDRLGIPPCDPPPPSTFNTKKHIFREYLEWPDLDEVDRDVAGEMRELARRYGYDVPG